MYRYRPFKKFFIFYIFLRIFIRIFIIVGDGFCQSPGDGRSPSQGMLVVIKRHFFLSTAQISVADPDPDPAFDPDPDPTFHLDVDTDPDPSFQIKSQNFEKVLK
jgi:hypothetical protein